MFQTRTSISIRFPRSVLLTILLLSCSLPLAAQTRQYSFDADGSLLEVHVPRAGLFSALGHDHRIRARELTGHVSFRDGSPVGTSLVMEVPVSGLSVEDPEVKEKTRGKIEKEMRGPEVLAQQAYPVIRFTAEGITQKRSGEWLVKGFLYVRGRSRQLDFPAQVSYPRQGQLLAVGTLELEPEIFGIEPVSALGGMVRTAETIEIHFRILGQLQPE